MNNTDKIDFNGNKIKIEDILKEKNKVILLNLYVKTHDLEITTNNICGKIDEVKVGLDDCREKMGIQWAKIGKNSTAISRLKGILVPLIPIILGIIGYIAYTR